MRRLIKRLFRERRRLIVVAAVTFLGGYIACFNSDLVFLGLPLSIAAGLLSMVGLTACLMALAILFPKVRHSVEAVALSIPVLSLMGAFGDASERGPSFTTIVMGVLLCHLILTVYGGTWLDRFIPRRPKRLRSFATSKLTPEELWPHLTVTPDTFADYPSEDTLSMEWIEPGVSFRQICRSGELAKVEYVHKIEVENPHQSYRFSFQVPDSTEAASCSRGTKEMKLIPKGGGTRLETIREFDRVTVRGQLFNWIDDALGRCDDEALQSAENANRA